MTLGGLGVPVVLQGNTAVQVTKNRVKIKAIYVLKTNTGDVVTINSGTSASNTKILDVLCDNLLSMPILNFEATKGLYITFTGNTAKVLLIYG